MASVHQKQPVPNVAFSSVADEADSEVIRFDLVDWGGVWAVAPTLNQTARSVTTKRKGADVICDESKLVAC